MKRIPFLIIILITILFGLLVVPTLADKTNALLSIKTEVDTSEVSRSSPMSFTSVMTSYLPFVTTSCKVTPTTPSCVQMLIPLYIYPDLGSPDSDWEKIAQAASLVPITVIINPSNGPGEACYPKYKTGIDYLRGAGVVVIAYVPTYYGLRDRQDVMDDIDMYHNCYTIAGVFLDEVPSEVTKENFRYYNTLSAYVRKHSSKHIIALNPGIPFNNDCYLHPNPPVTCDTQPPDPLGLPVADIVVIFEDFAATWPGYSPPQYICHYQPRRFSMIVHSMPTDVELMKNYIDLAIERGFGLIYLTDDQYYPDKNPWDTLPTFWKELVDYLRIVDKQRICR
jgi:hypothetical protein